MDSSDRVIDPQDIAERRQQNIGRLFLRGNRAYSARAVELLREQGHKGLSLAHTSLLANLDTSGTRISVLAERAGITKQSMGQLVLDLEQRGYIERTADPSDGRASIVMFTDKGRQFLVDAYHVKEKLETEYATILGEQDYQQLRSLLSKLLDAIDISEEIH